SGDIEYANGCIDRLVTANEKLLVEIADMGCNEEFIEFNISRLTIRDENLAERQNDLEIIDPEKEITLWKQYESMYNACLQMTSSAVPQSIFDYIK
ncbi:MAG: flagellin, partial [Oscillospiraceae bacterium]